MENDYQIDGMQNFRFQELMSKLCSQKATLKMMRYENDFQGILLPTFQL